MSNEEKILVSQNLEQMLLWNNLRNKFLDENRILLNSNVEIETKYERENLYGKLSIIAELTDKLLSSEYNPIISNSIGVFVYHNLVPISIRIPILARRSTLKVYDHIDLKNNNKDNFFIDIMFDCEAGFLKYFKDICQCYNDILAIETSNKVSVYTKSMITSSAGHLEISAMDLYLKGISTTSIINSLLSIEMSLKAYYANVTGYSGAFIKKTYSHSILDLLNDCKRFDNNLPNLYFNPSYKFDSRSHVSERYNIRDIDMKCQWDYYKSAVVLLIYVANSILVGENQLML